MSTDRIPISAEGVCPFHNKPVVQYDECSECLQHSPHPHYFGGDLELPNPFEEVLGG